MTNHLYYGDNLEILRASLYDSPPQRREPRRVERIRVEMAQRIASIMGQITV